MAEFKDATRIHTSFLAAIEKKALLRLAAILPAWVNSDHLTALGFVSLAAAAAAYAWSRWNPRALWLVIPLLALNWFGDSLDGTLARVRNHLRPSYGFYIDHILDACGAMLLVAGIAVSGYMSERVAAALLVVYLLLSIEIYLAAYALGRFHLSFWKFGPTELRLFLAAGTIALVRHPMATIAGRAFLLFDVGGVVAIAGIAAVLVRAIVKHTIALYRAESLG